jgi:hypothetical protein
MMNRDLAVVLTLLLATPTFAAEPFALVELFTSEGCSSCPLADAFLNELAADARNSGKRIFALAFHVDYWNHLGWTDPFSNPKFTQRQQDYANVLHSRSFYTPQMIVNGTEQLVGSDRGRARRAIESALGRSAPVTITLRCSDDPLTVHYEASGAPNDAALHLAVVESSLVQKVPRGENAGRTLHHDNVVRSIETIRLGQNMTGQVELHVPAAAVRVNLEVIGFIQSPTSKLVLGAARCKLPKLKGG